jgi:hypothetical protein
VEGFEHRAVAIFVLLHGFAQGLVAGEAGEGVGQYKTQLVVLLVLFFCISFIIKDFKVRRQGFVNRFINVG